jgi:hypothetical protein
MVEGGGFEPPKAEPSDLQSDPFDHSGTPPKCKPAIVLQVQLTVNSISTGKCILRAKPACSRQIAAAAGDIDRRSGPGPKKRALYSDVLGEQRQSGRYALRRPKWRRRRATRPVDASDGCPPAGASLIQAMHQRAQAQRTTRKTYHVVLYGNNNPSPGTGGVKTSVHHWLKWPCCTRSPIRVSKASALT